MLKSVFCTSVWGAALAVSSAGSVQAESPPSVMTSLQPVHSLVAGVMSGVGEPGILIRGAASPHSFQLRPSDARAMSEADLVVWVGESVETPLSGPIANIAENAVVLSLMDVDGLVLKETREGGAWDAHSHDDHGHDDHGHDDHGHDDHGHNGHGHGGDRDHSMMDGHIWLNPVNAIAIVRAAEAELARLDPAHAERYEENAAAVIERIEALDADVFEMLAPVADVPYIVFHDAYQYLEDRYSLNARGSITISPERLPGAQRLQEIRERLTSEGAVCLFREPQFESALINTMVEGTGARIGVLDPLGSDLEPGADAYFDMMRMNAEALADCLSDR